MWAGVDRVRGRVDGCGSGRGGACQCAHGDTTRTCHARRVVDVDVGGKYCSAAAVRPGAAHVSVACLDAVLQPWLRLATCGGDADAAD